MNAMQSKSESRNGVIEVFPTTPQLWFFLVIGVLAFGALLAYEFTLQRGAVAEEKRRTQAAVYFNATTLANLSQYESEIPKGAAQMAAEERAAVITEAEAARAKASETVELTLSVKLAEIYPAIDAEGQRFIRAAASDWKLARLIQHLEPDAAQSLLRDLISDGEERIEEEI